MLLTKKGFSKVLFFAILYFVLGSICIALSVICALLEIDTYILYLGFFCYAFCPISIFMDLYVEGTAKLINSGNKLVRNKLKPAEFIKQYESLRSSGSLVINKPKIEILHLVAIAYDSLDNKDAALKTVDEMISIAPEKKKTFTKLIKASLLFSYGKTEEAELIFTEVQSSKQDFLSQALSDAILKSDRAMAMGDYKTVEAHSLKMLVQKFPRLDNLGSLIINFRLGVVYEKLGNFEKAIFYYCYCADNGGETAIKDSAKSRLEELKN